MDENLVRVCDVESFSHTNGAASPEGAVRVDHEWFSAMPLYGSGLLASFGTSIWLVRYHRARLR
jgi:hypothetical protein